jgi:hypothetical protein
MTMPTYSGAPCCGGGDAMPMMPGTMFDGGAVPAEQIPVMPGPTPATQVAPTPPSP